MTEDVDTDAETEGVQLEVTGRLSVTDADGDGAFNTTPTFTSSTVEGGAQLGTLTIDAEGNWTYVVDNDNATVQGLNAGETIVETYTVATADGKDTQTITITINGAADDSSITLDTGDSATGSVTEDVDTDAETEGVQLEVTGRLSVTDADGDGAFNTTPTFTSSTVEGGAQLGTLTIDAEGNWTYVVDNDNATVQGLNAGETIVETYTVATADGKDTQTITITINGAADDSSITLDTGDSATGSVTEDVDTDAETEGVQLEVTGRLSVTDADGDGAFNTTPTFTSSHSGRRSSTGYVDHRCRGQLDVRGGQRQRDRPRPERRRDNRGNLHGCDGGWQRYTNHHDSPSMVRQTTLRSPSILATARQAA
nr:VCBS domain-containing protein [Vibrio furnissii]